MIKNKRNFSNSLKGRKSISNYIEFIKFSKEAQKMIKFKTLLEDKQKSLLSLKKNLTTNNSDSNYASINKNNHQKIIFVYNHVMDKLNKLIKTPSKNNYSILIKIKEFVNKITSNKKIMKTDLKEKYISVANSDKNIDKYSSYNSRSTINFINEASSDYIKEKKIKRLKQKKSNLENKLKTEKYKYLICIGEQNKKIRELEQELYKKSMINIPQNELKKYVCFPNHKKFGLLDKYISQSKDRCFSSYNIKRYKKYFLEEDEELNKSIKEVLNCEEKIINNNKIKGFDKQGSYLISHPKLKYVKDDLHMKTWKVNELLDSLPKSLMRHKFSSKLQRNYLIEFPSSLNQIMVNLEKLKIQNNFKSIENKFKDNKNIKNK